MPYVEPKLRPDILCMPVQEDGGTAYYYKNPLTNDFYKYNEIQHEILTRLDGKNTIDEICAELSEQFETEIPIEMCEEFVAHARELSLLDGLDKILPNAATRRRCSAKIRRGFERAGLRLTPPNDGGIAHVAAVSEGLKRLGANDPIGAADAFAHAKELAPDDPSVAHYHDLFWIAVREHSRERARLAAFGDVVDRTVLLGGFDSAAPAARLAKSFGPAFRPPLMVFSALLGLAGAALLVLSPAPLYNVRAAESVAYYVLFAIFVVIHEMGHATALSWFGRTPGFIGFGLMHGFRPFFFCDTSESLLLRPRERILVYLAGLETNCWLVFLLGLFTHFGPEDTAAYAIAHQFNWVIIFVTIWNLFPFSRGDLYVVLEETLGERDLDQKSYAYLRRILLRLWIGGEQIEAQPAKRTWIYLGFALGSLVTLSIIFHQVFLEWMFDSLVGSFGLLGFLGWIFITVIVFGHHIRRLALALGGLVRDLLPALKTRRGLIATTIVVGAPLAILLGPRLPLMIDAPFVLRPSQRVVIRAFEPGIVRRIFVAEGRLVRRGEVVAELESPELVAAIASAEAKVAKRRVLLLMLERGQRPEELEAKKRMFALAAAEAEHGRIRASRERQLVEAELRTRESLDRAEIAAGKAVTIAGVVKDELAEARAGARVEEIANARAELDAAEAELDGLRERAETLRLVAPEEGFVAYPRIDERIGEWLDRGEVLLELIDPRALRAEIILSARDPVAEIRIGAPVALKLNAAPDLELRSIVQEIAQQAHDRGQHIELRTERLALETAPSESSGRARIYGAPCTLGHRWLVLPLQRLASYDFWSLE